MSSTTSQIEISLQEAIKRVQPDKVFVLVDNNTKQYCWPQISAFSCLQGAELMCMKASDAEKNLQNVEKMWTYLSTHAASRKSLIINLGGGMITDLGGFVAATFKRGIPYINIPTTLLGMVDAATGGKTGINFNGLKNEIGCFYAAQEVILCSNFLKTLDKENIRSGYAEMLKHGLLSDREKLSKLLTFNLEKIDFAELQEMILESVNVKKDIVEKDPFEKGLRKALNLGHTVGHAFESLALAHNKPILHGYGVAWGIICALYLSATHWKFPHTLLHQVEQFVKETYGEFAITCREYDELYGYMVHDKKNIDGKIMFTLLENVGKVHINCEITKEEVLEMLDYFREN